MPGKQALREEFLQKRQDIEQDARRLAAAKVAELGLTLLSGCSLIGGYYPMRGEMDVLPLLARLAQKGDALCLPVTQPRERALAFFPWSPEDPVRKGKYAVMEPSVRATPVIPEVVLVPLVAFDRSGHRIGYGGGHYDATLVQLRAYNPRLLTVGVAFSMQETRKIPCESFDIRLDKVLTEHEIISF